MEKNKLLVALGALVVVLIAGFAGYSIGTVFDDKVINIERDEISTLISKSKEVHSAHWVEILVDEDDVFIAREQSLVGFRSLFSDTPDTVVYIWTRSQAD